MKDLADTKAFLIATDGTVNKERMADRECALRFLAFMIDPWQKYSTNDLDGFLGSAMTKLNGLKQSQRMDLKRSFEKAMNAAHNIFENDAFRKRYAEGDSRNPVSKALFEAWSVQLARCQDGKIQRLVNQKKNVKTAFIDLIKNDREFDAAVSYSTGVPQRVEKRFRAISQLINTVSP